jgi:hypothetical protein
MIVPQMEGILAEENATVFMHGGRHTIMMFFGVYTTRGT